MPVKPRVEPDLAMQRACRLLETIRAAVPASGATQTAITVRTMAFRHEGDYRTTEYRAAMKALRECGAINYKRGVYTRGELF